MLVIDVHTHMLNRSWFDLLREHGGPHYTAGKTREGGDCIMYDGASFLSPQPGHYDYALRIKDMNAAYVDMAIVSLTCPNVFFGDAAISTKAAVTVNDDMAAAQTAYPDRIRWMALARAICRHKEGLGLEKTQRIQNPAGMVRTIKSD